MDGTKGFMSVVGDTIRREQGGEALFINELCSASALLGGRPVVGNNNKRGVFERNPANASNLCILPRMVEGHRDKSLRLSSCWPLTSSRKADIFRGIAATACAIHKF